MSDGAGSQTVGKRTLIAYDESDGAERALRYAAALLPGGEAIVLYVYSSMPASLAPLAGMGLPPELEMDTSVLASRAEDLGRRGAELASSLGLQATPLVVDAAGASGIWSAIVRAAEEHDIDLIVVGSRGRSGLRAALLGSISSGVVHHACCPVLVVPPRRHDAD